MNSSFLNKIKEAINSSWIVLMFMSLPGLVAGQGILVLNPGKFLFTANDSCNISLTEPFKNSPSFSPDTSSILQLKYYSPNGYDYNLTDRIENSLIKMGSLKDGTYVIILHKKNSPLVLKEEEVKQFVSEFKPGNSGDLLSAASGQSLSINLQENSKTILQSGTFYTENCESPTTLPLEIVPDKNVYNLGLKAQKINFTLLYKGAPVQNAGITMVYKKDNATAPVVQMITTNKNGKARAVINPAGTYVLSYVLLNKPADPSQQAWTGYAANLLWGYLK